MTRKSVATDGADWKTTKRRCRYCKEPFVPQRRSQEFCPRPAKCRIRAWEAEHPRARPPKRVRVDHRPSCHIRLDPERWAKLGAAADRDSFQSGEPCSRVDVVRGLIDRMEMP